MAENRAKDQAKAQLESIVAMVQRLEHARECNGACELTDQAILDGLCLSGTVATDEEREQYHDENEAREAMNEDPLSVEVRSDWHVPGRDEGATEYLILLCTGGPACRIIGDLDQHNEPETAKLQYQDWFTPWKDYTEQSNEEALLIYARCFYFGE